MQRNNQKMCIRDRIYVATRGGPNFATRSAVMYIYQAAFEKQRLGYASAMAVLLFIIIIAIAGSARAYLNHRERKML